MGKEHNRTYEHFIFSDLFYSNYLIAFEGYIKIGMQIVSWSRKKSMWIDEKGLAYDNCLINELENTLIKKSLRYGDLI